MAQVILGKAILVPAAHDRLEHMLGELRGCGWLVATHNDDILDGKFCTFWLFTHSNGKYIKGEGGSDQEAGAAALLRSVEEQ